MSSGPTQAAKEMDTHIPKHMPDSFSQCLLMHANLNYSNHRFSAYALIINTVFGVRCGVVQGDRHTQHRNNKYKNNGLMSLFLFSVIGMTENTMSLICDSYVTVCLCIAAGLSSLRTCYNKTYLEQKKMKN